MYGYEYEHTDCLGTENSAIFKLKEMQEEIIKNEKLALIGQMTSGLAHEIGNPITSIIGLSQLLLQSNTNRRTVVQY